MPPGSSDFHKFGSPTLRSSALPRRKTRSSHTLPSPVGNPCKMPLRNRKKLEIKSKKEKSITDVERQELVERVARIQTHDVIEKKSSTDEKPPPPKKDSWKIRRSVHPAAEIYTKKLYRLVATGHDLDADSDTDIPGCSQRAVITDNWKPEYSDGTQELAHPDELPRMEVEDDGFFLKPKEDFELTKKLIACNQDSTYYDIRTHEPADVREPFHYEVTAHDIVFIKRLNEKRLLSTGEPYLILPTFVKIIQSLEIEAFKQIHNHLLDSLHVVYTRPPEDGGGDDAECDVCRIPDCDVSDEMVFCDMCNTCVHMVCAGIQELPNAYEPWKCAKCEHAGTPCPPCVLCPALGGSMTYNHTKTEWAHHSCALFMPEIIFEDEELRAPMTAFNKVPEERFTQLCTVCDTRQGACVTCSEPDCEETYHVCCALRAGMTVRIQEVPNDPEHNVTRVTYCHRHTNPHDIIIDERYRNHKNPWLAKLESVFFLMTDYEKIAEKIGIEEIIVSDVYEYWKQKRMANGAPLIPHLQDHIRIEPVIERVAKKAAGNLESSMAAAGISTGELPSASRPDNRFFRPAALMVTELRQHHLKRVAAAIRRDIEMLTMLETRETIKRKAIDAEFQQIRMIGEMLKNGMNPMVVMETLKIPKAEIRKAQQPAVFASIRKRLEAMEMPTISEFRRQIMSPLKRKHPSSKNSLPILNAAHQKSPLRPRNSHNLHNLHLAQDQNSAKIPNLPLRGAQNQAFSTPTRRSHLASHHNTRSSTSEKGGGDARNWSTSGSSTSRSSSVRNDKATDCIGLSTSSEVDLLSPFSTCSSFF